MPKAEPIPLDIPPGIVKTESPVSQEGRFIDGDHVRFQRGKLEKIGGWEKWLATGQQFSGIARGMHGWLDNDTIAQVAIGTTTNLYTVDTDGELVDVTPIQESGTLTDPFSTSNGLTTVTVTDTAHGRTAGDTVIFSGASAVGGITVTGTYTIASIVDANTYTITHGSPAGSTAGPGGGSVSYQYVLTLGVTDAAPGLGYGIGTYGTGTYGTPRSSSPIVVEPRIWHLDNFGELLLGVASGYGLYSWDPNTPSTRAAIVSGAPTANRGMFVTGERFVTCLGTDGDPLVVQWASQNTIDDWTPTSTNTANERRLQAGSKIMAGRRLGAGANMIWTDTACYLHQFTGSAFVYDTRIIGENTGLIAALAVVTVAGTAYWMSPKAFYMSGGGAPAPIPRQGEIQDWVFQNLTEAQQLKCMAAFFEEENEIWWFYPAGGTDEPNRYVMVCLDDYSWSIGTMARTAYTRLSTGGSRPLMAGTDGYVYEHEVGTDADGAALEATVEYAPFSLGEGLQNMECLGYIPDMERQTGDITLTISTWDRYRAGTPFTETLTFDNNDGIVDARSDGRQMGFELTSNVVGGDFRFGRPQILVKAKGTRR